MSGDVRIRMYADNIINNYQLIKQYISVITLINPIYLYFLRNETSVSLSSIIDIIDERS